MLPPFPQHQRLANATCEAPQGEGAREQGAGTVRGRGSLSNGDAPLPQRRGATAATKPPHGSVGGQQQDRAGARMGQPVAPQGSVTWGFLQGCSTEQKKLSLTSEAPMAMVNGISMTALARLKKRVI